MRPILTWLAAASLPIFAAPGGWEGTQDPAAPAGDGGRRHVIVELAVETSPEGLLAGSDAIAAQRGRIEAVGRALAGRLPPGGHRITRRYRTLPFIALEADAATLRLLALEPMARGLSEDRLAGPVLAESVPLVEADRAWYAGYAGRYQAIAVLDTGIDPLHPNLRAKVVEEACFSANGSCPDGGSSQTGPGAAVPCGWAAATCAHGTRVANIAAGSGGGFSGVARDARLIAIQVFSRLSGQACQGTGEDPCARSFTSDQVAGLEQVALLSPSLRIASANLSLAGGAWATQAACDADNPAIRAAVQNLLSLGIPTVAAAGNGGFTGALSAPACVSGVVSVSSTNDTDVVSSFSNSAEFLTLFAPGERITSAVPGDGFDTASGTSYAAPHAAGALAVLKQAAPGAAADGLVRALIDNGVPVIDHRNGLLKPRLAVDAALRGRPTACGLSEQPAAPAGEGFDLAALAASLRGAPGNPDPPIASPLPGTVVYLHLEWSLTGGVAPVPVLMEADRDGTPICSCRFEAAPGRSYLSHCADGLTATAGTHRIRFRLRPEDGAAEVDASNNEAVLQWIQTSTLQAEIGVPGSAGPLILTRPVPGWLRLAWGAEEETISYRVIGGEIGWLAPHGGVREANAFTMACRLFAPTVDLPEPEGDLFFLVAGENEDGGGSAGADSAGNPRGYSDFCP
jgi:subtilisin family serine protease